MNLSIVTLFAAKGGERYLGPSDLRRAHPHIEESTSAWLSVLT